MMTQTTPTTRLTYSQKLMLEEAHKSGGRVHAADFWPGDACGQSAFHRTCGALVKKGLMIRSHYSNGELMNAYEVVK